MAGSSWERVVDKVYSIYPIKFAMDGFFVLPDRDERRLRACDFPACDLRRADPRFFLALCAFTHAPTTDGASRKSKVQTWAIFVPRS